MEIPVFKPTKEFWDGVEADCLVAKLRNSQLPGVGAAYIAEFKEDPVFTVLVRGGADITEWQKQTLDLLFRREGLRKAIETGLALYQALPAFSEEEIDDDVRRDGLLAHVHLNKVILDDSRREVMLTLSSIAVADIDEHGLVVHGSEQGWKVSQLDYVNEYLSEIQSTPGNEKEPQFMPVDPSLFFGRWETTKPMAGISVTVDITPETIGVSMRGLPILPPRRWTACEQTGNSIVFHAQSGDFTFGWVNGVLHYGDDVLKKLE